MPARLNKLVKRLANEGLKTLQFFRGLEPQDWQQQIYVSGSQWRAREILGHLLDAEQGFHYLLGDVLLGGPGAPEGMDVNAHNEQHVSTLRTLDPAALLGAFAQARVTTLDLVRGMQPADLDRVGRHPFLGMATIEEMIKLIYRHNMLHQRDIRRALDSGVPVDADAANAPTPGG
ncbi:MAG: DinB family protein [Anaerolineae bacterium]|nr:DinB family protein [Anaerolineae bacterium]